MTATEFIDRWPEDIAPLSSFCTDKLQSFGLKPETIDFLSLAGLPEQAAPFLGFSDDSNEIYRGINKLTAWFNFLEPEFERYIVIGNCNDGDIIAINVEQDDAIERLDHENYFSSSFFNSSINALAGCLVAYTNFVNLIQDENGIDAFKLSNFSDSQFKFLVDELRLADEKAVTVHGFWKQQLEMLIGMRVEYFERNHNSK